MNKKKTQNEKATGEGKIISDDSSSRIIEHTSQRGAVLGTVHTGSGNIKISAFPSEYELSKLHQFADILEATRPSAINDQIIVELEYFLNNLYYEYRRHAEVKLNTRLIETIEEALAVSASLSYGIRDSDRSREPSFFRDLLALKELVRGIYGLFKEQYR